MLDDFFKYERLKTEGKGPHAIYLAAVADGLDSISCIRMLRSIFGLSLTEAKEITVTAAGESANLSQHQAKLAPALKAALDADAADRKDGNKA